jgi:lysophospholipase L1-like esterase
MERSFSLETNSLGFRDREFNSSRMDRTRILALGDSFTYGWGVEIEQSWPKILESKLRAAGRDVEVANLGKPGGSPKDYADIAEKATPILKPDLIIVAVLQGDDLAQMEQVAQDTNNRTGNAPKTTGERYGRALIL